MYTYSTAPPVTQTQGLNHLDVNHYVEIENDLIMYTDEMVNRKIKDLEDAVRILRGIGSNQSVKYKDLVYFPRLTFLLVTRSQNLKSLMGS